MGTFFAYSIVVSLILTLGYGGYRMNRNGSAAMRRTVLLGIYSLALVIVPILLSQDFSRNGVSMGTENAVITEWVTLPEIIIPAGETTLSFFDILLRIYVSGVVVCTLLTLTQLFRVIMILKKSRRERIENRTIYVHNRRDIGPFSIGGIIAANADDIETPAIMKHESAHIAFHHSIDLLIAQLTAIICWYCPTVWYVRKELKLVHEFQSDEAVLGDGAELRSYCRMLVERAAGLRILAIANSLNHNNLKQRIKMMQTPKEKRRGGRSRALFSFAAIVCAAILLSVPAVSNAIGQISQSALHVRGLDTKGTEKATTFVVYGVDLNMDVVKNGNFKVVSEFENVNIDVKNLDGVIFPRTGAIICQSKNVLTRLTPTIRKYTVDGKIVSAKDFSKIPAKDLAKVAISGNSMQAYTRKLLESQEYDDAVMVAINVEYRLTDR